MTNKKEHAKFWGFEYRRQGAGENMSPQSALHAQIIFFLLLFPYVSQVEAGKSWVCLWLTLLGTMETLMWNCGQTFVPLWNWLLYFIFKHKLKLPGTFVSHSNHRKENPRVNRHFWEQPIQKTGKSMEYFGSDFEVIFLPEWGQISQAWETFCHSL